MNEDAENSTTMNVDDYMTKIDIGLLGFLWCQGSKELKAKFLFDLLKASEPKHRAESS